MGEKWGRNPRQQFGRCSCHKLTRSLCAAWDWESLETSSGTGFGVIVVPSLLPDLFAVKHLSKTLLDDLHRVFLVRSSWNIIHRTSLFCVAFPSEVGSGDRD